MREGWEVKTLGEVATFLGGGTPSKKHTEFWNGEIPWVSPKDMKFTIITDSRDHITPEAIEGSATKLVPKDSILIVVRSGILSRTIPTAISGRELTINQDLKAIIPNALLEHRFLAYFLQAVEPVLLRKVTRGATVHKLDMPVLKLLAVPLPPLAEQKRIVTLLDQAFAGIELALAAATKNLKNARELFETTLNTTFTQKGEGWVEEPLANFLNKITYGFTNPMPTTETGPFLVTAKNVRGGIVDYKNARHTSQEAFDNLITAKSRPIAGDVLLTKDGTLGRLAVVERDGLCVNQSVAVLRPNERILPFFLKTLLSSPNYQKLMIADAGGTTIKHIYITRVDKMVISVPSLKGQQEINDRLEFYYTQTQHLEALYQQKIDALNELKQSLLQKAFAGELTAEAQPLEANG